jgi:hypothetical protein
MTTILLSQLQKYQQHTFRLTEKERLRTPAQAIKYVEERGFIFFWPVKGTIFPNLWSAVAGDRPVADEHDDPGHITWGWKDQLLDKRVWYYARILRKRNTIVSLKTIPYFYALSPNYGLPEEDILDQYQAGLLPLETKLIFQTLLEKGPLDTIELRRQSHLTGSTSNGPFNRALDILQRDLKVLPVGIADAGTWHYAFVYDLTHRHYPQILDQAREISEFNAVTTLLEQYLSSVGAATQKEIHMFFGWHEDIIAKAIHTLTHSDKITLSSLENQNEEVLAIVDLLNFH